ncbi:response regulator transcription factor [Patescibacteria group bacterium]|nr:response regulator transcription factor [Patescibacteria group bacterium]
MKILVIEDEKGIANFISEGLQLENYLVDLAYLGQDGLDKALINEYDLIILDLMLPDISGLKVCRELRENNASVPVLMLTAKNTTEDKITGLDTGADDYLTKPFDFDELLARIRALLRRGQSNIADNIIKVGPVKLNTKTHEVNRSNKKLTLTNKEYKLLEYLMRRPDEVISRHQILEHVWETDTDPFSNTVEVHIRYLRQKIDKNYSKKLIKTIRGAGYKISH